MTELFIEKARRVHGDMYDYSKVEYKHSKIHVTLLCSTHGEFLSRPNDHLNGHGCKQCGIYRRSIERTSNTHAFIEKAKQIHGDKYDYSKVVYTKNHHKIILVCSTHGEFLCSPGDHINKKYARVRHVNLSKTRKGCMEKIRMIIPK